MKLSKRSGIAPFIVMDVMEAARKAEEAGRHIVHMEVGQPGAAAPADARVALEKAMQDEPMGYTVALGLPALREGIAALYKRRHGLDISAQRVVVTAGSSGAFILAFTALFDAGAKVALGAPGYPSYKQILSALDIVPVSIPTKPENRYQPVPEELVPGLDGLIVASPANPSGTMLGRAQLSALIEACARNDTAFISDEIYHGIEYESPAVSALEISDDVVVINSFSKYFSMTGWRVGWMVVPENMVRPIERLAQNMFICAPHASQIAALGALECDAELQANLDVYRENRRLMMAGLPRAGFAKIAPPDGAFYIYADVSDYTSDSRAFAAEILEEAGVAVTPGLDFDAQRGHQALRFSYAGASEDIAEGLARLERFMQHRFGIP